MTHSLFGRLQTRAFLVLVVGSLWTLLVTPLLPRSATLGEAYRATFAVLALVLLAGLAWDLVYHLLQQLRREQDWPIGLSLLNCLNEGLFVWVLIRNGLGRGAADLSVGAFILYLLSTWLAMCLFVLGPMRLLFLRWRFRAGEVV